MTTTIKDIVANVIAPQLAAENERLRAELHALQDVTLRTERELTAQLAQSREQTAAALAELSKAKETSDLQGSRLTAAQAKLCQWRDDYHALSAELCEVRGVAGDCSRQLAEACARAEAAERERDELGRALMAKGADTTQEREVSKLREAIGFIRNDLLDLRDGLVEPNAGVPLGFLVARSLARTRAAVSPAATTCPCGSVPGSIGFVEDCPEHGQSVPAATTGEVDDGEARAYHVGLRSGEAMGVETAAKLCESMVVGGRAWTHDQSVAADALLTAAQRIRTVIQTATPSRVIGVDKFTGEPVHSPAPIEAPGKGPSKCGHSFQGSCPDCAPVNVEAWERCPNEPCEGAKNHYGACHPLAAPTLPTEKPAP